ERLAEHAFRGEVWEQAARYARQAGQRAFERSANREAVTWFEQALAALRHLDHAPAAIEAAIDIPLELPSALTPLGECRRILDELETAERLALTLGDDRRSGRVASFLVDGYASLGEHEGAMAAGRRALAIADALQDVPLKVVANVHLYSTLSHV